MQPGNGLGLQAALQTEAFILEVISLKDKLEREIRSLWWNIVIMTFFFASSTYDPGSQIMYPKLHSKLMLHPLDWNYSTQTVNYLKFFKVSKMYL